MDFNTPGLNVGSDFSFLDEKNDENFNGGCEITVFFIIFLLFLLLPNDGFHRAIEPEFHFPLSRAFQTQQDSDPKQTNKHTFTSQILLKRALGDQNG